MTKGEARLLLAAAAWTLYVWISRVVILAGGDESLGFKVVHFVLAGVSVFFAVAIARIGWRHLRSSAPGAGSEEPAYEPPRRG